MIVLDCPIGGVLLVALLLLEVHRRAVSQGRMTAGGPALGQTDVGIGFEAAPVDQFALRAGKETLGHCVVVDVAPASHGRA